MPKIPRPTVERVTALLAPLDTPDRRAHYRAGDFPRADVTRDRDKRYRWDLWWQLPDPVRRDTLDTLDDVTDAHVDTMLRRAVPPL